MDEERIYQAYYTDSDPLVRYMVAMLDLKTDSHILEPCAGNGAFLAALIGEKRQIDAYEIAPDAVTILHENFGGQVNIFQANMLTDVRLNQRIANQAGYDRIIANPPYGAWLDYDQRKIFKQQYPDLYIKETYTLFLYRCIHLLKPEGKLVFIMPDTWLNLHRHTALRKFILENTTLLEIAQFPSSFFPQVNFGYANLCILTLQRKPCAEKHRFIVYTGFANVKQLATKEQATAHHITQKAILSNIDHALFLAKNPTAMTLINQAETRIGSIADCVTGFYSGNDKHFLKTRLDKKRYEKIDESLIHNGAIARDGIAGERCYVPIVKGGARHYIKPDDWFMLWSKDAVAHFQQDKKARYQNPTYYFRQGLGVPMVSSSQITAALLDYRLFDQSIVGIFPHDEADLFYLLALFNSPTCNMLIRTINPSANNSAKYIQKIPFLRPIAPQQQQITNHIKTIIQSIQDTQQFNPDHKAEVDAIIARIYGF